MPTLEKLARVRSKLSKDTFDYLTALKRSTLHHPLLQEIAGFDLQENWLSLRCMPERLPIPRQQSVEVRDKQVATSEAASQRQMGVADTSDGAEFSQPASQLISAETFIAGRPSPETWGATVILGDPGAGKTELLRWRARQEAEDQLARLDRAEATPGELCPPLYVSLKRIPKLLSHSDSLQKRTRERIENIVAGAVETTHGISDELLRSIACLLTAAEELPLGSTNLLHHISRQWLRPNRPENRSRPFLLCLDGWDEVRAIGEGGGDRASVAELLRPLLRAIINEQSGLFGNLQVLVSSRRFGFENHLLPVSRRARLVPLQPVDVTHYIQRFFARLDPAVHAAGMGTVLEKHLRLNPGVHESCSNPMVLSLLCCDYSRQLAQRATPTIPQTRAELYHRILKELVGRASRIHKGVSAEGSDSFSDEKLRALGAVAGTSFPMLTFKQHEIAHCFPADSQLMREVLQDDLVLKAQSDTGSEFAFLHPTFHEYLAATNLVEKSDLADQLVEAAMKPSWAQVTRMALGIASLEKAKRPAKLQPAMSFRNLVAALAAPDRQPWPGFASLLLSNAAGDLGRLQEEDSVALCEQLFSDWVAVQFGESKLILANPIEEAFGKLHRGPNRPLIELFLRKKLAVSKSAAPAAHLLLRAGISLAESSSIQELCLATEFDGPDLNWPIHSYLATQIATASSELFVPGDAESQETEPSGLRSWIQGNHLNVQRIDSDYGWGVADHSLLASTLNKQIQLRRLLHGFDREAHRSYLDSSPELQTLIGILCGGLDSLRIRECLENLIEGLRSFTMPQQPGQRHRAARELDLVTVPWRDAITKRGVRFDPRKIFIRSALDTHLVAWTVERQSMPAIVEALQSLLSNSAETTEVRAEAAIALTCLAAKPREDLISALPNEVLKAMERRMALLRVTVEDAVLRAASIALDAVCSAEDDVQSLVEQRNTVRLIHRVNRQFGGFPLGLTTKTPERLQIAQYSEFMARAVSGFQDDNPEYPEDHVYNLCVTLDTIGKSLAANQCLPGWLSSLPFTENAMNELATVAGSWRRPRALQKELASGTEENLDFSVFQKQLTLCLDALYSFPQSLGFFSGWAMAAVIPAIRDAYPELLTEALFFASRNFPDDIYGSLQMVMRAAGRTAGPDAEEVIAKAEELSEEAPKVSARLYTQLVACRASEEPALVDSALPVISRITDARERADELEWLAQVCRSVETFRKVVGILDGINFPSPGEDIREISLEKVEARSFAESLVWQAARLHSCLAWRECENSGDALWRRALNDPNNPLLRRQLMAAVRTYGFVLTRERAAVLSDSVERHGPAAVRPFLEIPRRAGRCARLFLLRWLHELDEPDFRDLCAVLLMEQGVLIPAIVTCLPRIIESANDAVRQRMQYALVPDENFGRSWKLSELGAEVVLGMLGVQERYRESRCGIALHFSWFLGRLEFDDVPTLDAIHALAESEGQNGPAFRLLSNIRRLSADAFERSLHLIGRSSAPLQQALVEALQSLWTIHAAVARSQELLISAENVLEKLVQDGPVHVAMASLAAWQKLSYLFGRLPKECSDSCLRRAFLAAMDRAQAKGNEGLTAGFWLALGRLASALFPNTRAQLATGVTEGRQISSDDELEQRWFRTFQEGIREAESQEAKIGAVSLFIEAGLIEAAYLLAQRLPSDQVYRIVTEALDSNTVSQQFYKTAAGVARLLMRDKSWFRNAFHNLLNLLSSGSADRRARHPREDGARMPRGNLLLTLGQCLDQGADLAKEFADETHVLEQMSAAISDCLTGHNTYPGRRSALRMLHALPSGVSLILNHMNALIRDCSVVTGGILTDGGFDLSDESIDDLITQVEERSGHASGLEVGYSIVLLANRMLASETEISLGHWRRLIKITGRLADTGFHMIHASEFGSQRVISSASLGHWVVERLCQMLHLSETAPHKNLVPYFAFDVQRKAVFPDWEQMGSESVRLYVSERPQKGKRTSEYQLRFFGDAFFGSETTTTNSWFKELSDYAEKGPKNVREIFQDAIPSTVVHR